MKDYKLLAINYLKLNKRRSIVTILGVIVTVVALYTMLNLGWSRVLMQREIIREENDYELVFLTEEQSQIENIMADSRVKSAKVGAFFDHDYFNPKTYENALYVNTTNPYNMDEIKMLLESYYGVTSYYNEELAWTYLQGGEANTTVIGILMLLLISFIFAIFGVGIVRNSVQLSTLEQIKDYGNLRCIGASKGQLKKIVYLQGAILEISGIVLGIILGTLVSWLIGRQLKWNVGFHVLPVIPIAVSFLGDLFFAMDENCKLIVNLTPVSAIRGEYRIKKEKIKIRKQNIFGKLFGVEGDYAYKNVMRNPGRFVKTVSALGIGVGAFMAIAGGIFSINNIIQEENERYGYYSVFYEGYFDVVTDIGEAQGELPPAKVLERISNLEEVTDAKRVYFATVMLSDQEEFAEHLSEQKKQQYQELVETAKKFNSEYAYESLGEQFCFGYDEEDIKRYESVLEEGTLDVSENGIILVNGGAVWDDNGERPEDEKEVYTEYKVGDTIEFFDMKRLREMLSVKIEELNEQYEKDKEDILLKKNSENEEEIEDQLADLNKEYTRLQGQYYVECKKELKAENAYKTYTIEGIVSEDVNRPSGAYGITFVLPLEQYYELTGTDESMSVGMQYHFEKFNTKNYENAVTYNGKMWNCETMVNVFEGPYYLAAELEGIKDVAKWILLIVIFVVTMSAFNIIDTTASNLHMRRKELAQLRVIGVTKEGLMKMVMLEGVIASIVANVIGIILGTVLSGVSVGMILKIAYNYSYKFPFASAMIGILASTLILCGSVYAPLKGLKQDMAADLATGGD